ncbi:Putative nucleotide phosphoribosyltransferase [hydrothermal vent metagenome]|uniref:Nucleotide phosphoribosyltransferase n=1 Tax=hydrothermal vent metagenome TaxID=652676 RepID=A0A3B1E973_9ZZZZ
MSEQYYSYNHCIKDCKTLLPQLKKYNPDGLVAIARGGLTIGHILAHGLNTNNLFSINCIHYHNQQKMDTFKISNIPDLQEYKKIVLVDDIVDSGETIIEIKKALEKKYKNTEFKIATLFYKTTASIKPDFTVNEATKWINFFWEVDL